MGFFVLGWTLKIGKEVRKMGNQAGNQVGGPLGDRWLNFFWYLVMILGVGSLVVSGFNQELGMVGVGLTCLSVVVFAVVAAVGLATIGPIEK